MDNYYSKQIDELKSKMTSLINENNELMNEKIVIQNEMNSKQQKVVDLWVQVFKEFKDCFNSPTEVQNLINSFGHTNINLVNIKEFQDEKELKKLREESNTKEVQIRELTEIKNREENKYRKSIREMIEIIKEKLKTYNELNERKGQIIGEIDENSQELIKVNESKINYGNNEVSGIEENKKKLVELIDVMKQQKLVEIETLRDQIKRLEAHIKNDDGNYFSDVLAIKTNCDEQLKIIKDREDYITKQTDIVSNNLKSIANQNEKAVEALRQENQQLKNQNFTLSKKLDK
jgi:hypothetical protein